MKVSNSSKIRLTPKYPQNPVFIYLSSFRKATIWTKYMLTTLLAVKYLPDMFLTFSVICIEIYINKIESAIDI